jgi:predicted metal-dependent enzyme (double-stranded beta helix superfamily)
MEHVHVGMGAPRTSVIDARDDLRAEISRWRRRLRFGGLIGLNSSEPGAARSYLRLPSCAQCEVWLICWPPGSRAPLHDHGGARGIASVLCGELQEFICERRGVGRPEWIERTWRSGCLIELSAEACHYARTATGGVEALRSESSDRW